MKYPNTTLNLLTVPDGYILVEFFGSHDFGWIIEGTVHPMTYDGKLPFEDGKIGKQIYCLYTLKYLNVLCITYDVLYMINNE